MAAVVTSEALRTACLASSGALWSVVPCRGGAEKRAKPQFRSWMGWGRGAHRRVGEGTAQSAWSLLAAQPGL